MALQVHRAELPVRRGQNMDGSVSGQSLCLREPLGQPWTPFPHSHISGSGSWSDRAGNQTYLGAAAWGEPHSKKSGVFSLSLFPYLWGGRGSWGKHCAQVSAHLSPACPWAPSHPEPGE